MTTHESAQPCGCDRGANWTCEQHRGLGHSYIEMDGIVAVGSRTPEPNCSFCGFLLTPTDTFCCPACGWKV